MKTIELKLKQKNQFEAQLKKGNKVVEKIIAVKDGWYACCKVHRTFEMAVEYARLSTEQMYNMTGDDYIVVITA